MLVHDSALCAVTVGKHDIMHVKKDRHTAQGSRPRGQLKLAIQAAIHRQFMAIRTFFGNSRFIRGPKIRKLGQFFRPVVFLLKCTPESTA